MPDFRDSFTAHEVCERMVTEITVKNKSKSSWQTEKFAKIVSKRSHQEECVQSTKTAKCVAPCVASEVPQVTDKLPSLPSKADFSQIEGYTSKPRCRLDRSWNRALANRSLPAQQSRHQDKKCVQLHHRAQGWREAQLQRAKTTTFSAERRSFQSVNMISCLYAACTRKMATLR